MKLLAPSLIALGVLFGDPRTVSAGAPPAPSAPATPSAPAAPAVSAASAASDMAGLNRAAGLYHQASYDSARARLEALLAQGAWRRRDSLMILQYLGMSWSRLGADSQAVDRFHHLLALDSLFRFPRNEDAAVLRNFGAARDRHAARSTIPRAPVPQVPPAPIMAPVPAGPATLPASDSLASAAMDPATPTRVDPLRARSDGPPSPRRMSLALGAVPLGGGWLASSRTTYGVSLGVLQAGGILLSFYASGMQSRLKDGDRGLEPAERDAAIRWQWAQRVSLSTAVGAYLYSIIASGGD